ncbi:serine/threonine protein phosphatase PrpC [Mucilaginibacter sp. UYP25]|uniref:PP2C family serine/threonine-protein phosphatase n=1 Tax=unclassified Mucilaginibacter TaxID=2617802 RepID=UPI00339B2252
MEIKAYIQNLLNAKSNEIKNDRIKLLDEFANNPINTALVKLIFENQSKIMVNWDKQNRLADINNQHIIIPNAKEFVPYSAKLDFIALKLNDIVDVKFEGLEELGLTFNKEIDTIEGTPSKSGDVKFKLLFHLKGDEETQPLNEKLISLVINPDPKSLWKLQPSDQNAIFAKPDDVDIFDGLGEKNIVVSSKRGRSHGKEGSSRDDDFAFKHFHDSKWSLIVLSDGAGSAFLARAGSKIACESVIEYFKNVADIEKAKEFEDKIFEFSKDQTEEKLKEIQILSKQNLYKASVYVHNKLKEFAAQTSLSNPELFNNPKAKSSLEYFHSTLIFALFKKFDFGYIIQSFGVGDCPIAVMNKELTETTLLNWLDVGEYGGGTRFITQPEIFQKQEVMITRFNLKIIEDFSYLFLMTDGVYDAKFVVEANLDKHEKWIEFLKDLDGNNEDNSKVEFNKNNAKIGPDLSKWMDFWSAGNHDDRTLAIVF